LILIPFHPAAFAGITSTKPILKGQRIPAKFVTVQAHFWGGYDVRPAGQRTQLKNTNIFN